MTQNHSPEDRKQELLDRFLADNEDLESLAGKLKEFNLFRVLRIERAEIRHSNILAWLLSPSETHGLGDRFLRRFLSHILIDRKPATFTLRATDIELADLSGSEVSREWMWIDILILVPSVKLVIVIENKIGAYESQDQLGRYFKEVRAAFPGHAILPVFLTLEGDSPSDGAAELGYVAASHSEVLEVLEKVAHSARANISESASFLIDNYLTTLRRLTMNDNELALLCKRIYKNHREAIDLIVEYAAGNEVLEACSAVVKEVCRPAYNEIDAHRVWFLPSEWAKYTVARSVGGWTLPTPYAVLWWFYYHRDNGKLQLSLEVGPMDDVKQRQSILKAARAEGFKFQDGALGEDAKFTRVLTVTKKFDPDESDNGRDTGEDVKKIARELWTQAWPQGEKMGVILKKYL